MDACAGMFSLPGDARDRLAKCIRLLGSNQPNEVVAAAGAIGRLLSAHGTDWHALAAAVAPSSRDDPLLDEYAAAEHLGVAPATMRKWRVYGDGPEYCKIGRRVRYRLSALDRFADAGRRTSTSA